MEPVSDDAMTTCKVVPQRTVRIRKTNGLSVPLGVTGNTPDSGSGESWFDPRRGNSKRDAEFLCLALFVFASVCHRFCHRFSRHHFDIMRRDAGFTASRASIIAPRISTGTSTGTSTSTQPGLNRDLY